MSVMIIDYGMSNLGSIKRAVEECGGDAVIADDPRELKKASKIILPGVGSYADGMGNLRKYGWFESINEEAGENGVPLLGICLGMQLLSERGCEGGDSTGLGLIKGEVKKLAVKDPGERLPHVGWNEISIAAPCVLLEGIADGSDFYFVHSYYFDAADAADVIAYTPYCGRFPSILAHKNIYATQFHPEKSSPDGFKLLKNFLNI